MQEFYATIIETLTKVVIIKAESKDEAYAKVRSNWCNKKYTLDADDFDGVFFDVTPSAWRLNDIQH